MKTESLNYHLPGELIAQHPVHRRSDARLLVLDRKSGMRTDTRFGTIGRYLWPGDCLVLNRTKVLPARFYGQRQTGAGLEGLFIQALDQTHWEVMLKGARKLALNETFLLFARDKTSVIPAALTQRLEDGKCIIRLDAADNVEQVLETIGFAPLPPYIKRTADPEQAKTDRRRYQTVYAREAGAVAAPTAGLHFTAGLLQTLRSAGVQVAELILHVGLGTFKPVTALDLKDHVMHAEQVIIEPQTADLINDTRRQGGRIIAVGTTSVRSLESAARGSGRQARLTPLNSSTRLFITPGYEFKLVDAMVTNFHLPKSTLLALVAAFTGLDVLMETYAYAVRQRYRFYSYGDAMLIL